MISSDLLRDLLRDTVADFCPVSEKIMRVGCPHILIIWGKVVRVKSP